MATRKTQEDKRLLRLVSVAEFMLLGKTQHQIAVELGISESTASRDVRTVREKWALESQETVAELVAKESKRLEYILEKLMPRVAAGMYGSIDRVLKIIELKMKLYGVDSKHFAENMRDLLTDKASSDDNLGTLSEAVRELQTLFDERGSGKGGNSNKKAVPPDVLN